MQEHDSKLIITVNAGSSSIKIGLFNAHRREPRPTLFGSAKFDGIGTMPRLKVTRADGTLVAEKIFETAEANSRATAFKIIFPVLLDELKGRKPALIVHRIVHGGEHFVEPVLITPAILDALKNLIPLAPLHQPYNIAPIDDVFKASPTLPQVACFDTALHAQRSKLSMLTGLPYSYYEQGVRRYGFHGLSFEYICQKLRKVEPEVAAGRVIIAHLGSGVGLCAVVDGNSVEVSTSFTALDGSPMGTRTGTLDPGVMLHLVGQGLSHEALEKLLYRQSGLLGISGVSSDMRELRASTEPRAKLAIDYFAYHLAQQIGRLAVAAGGMDALVFTAGIGEKDAALRAQVVEQLKPIFHMTLDVAANTQNALHISTAQSAVKVMVIPTNEESMLATHGWHVLQKPTAI